MDKYYIAVLIVTPLALIFKGRMAVLLIAACCSTFLAVLPSTGFDYDYYKQAFDHAYHAAQFPWFYTDSILTAEPLYIWYTSAVSVITPLPFQGFLVLNFILCVILSLFSFKKTKYIRIDLFWVSFLPVVFPTLFYFSPRSSLSFFLVLFGFFLLCQRRIWLSFGILAIAVSLHSQYILVCVFFIAAYFSYAYSRGLEEKIRRRVGLALILLSGLCLVGVHSLMGVLSSVLGVLPSSEIALSKLHYLEASRSGYRITSILSIIIYPIIFYLMKKRKDARGITFFNDNYTDQVFVHMLGLVILFGAMVNLVFFDQSHLAGRLSRFSDYMGMGVIIPAFLVIYFGRELCILGLWVMALVAPLVYGTVYNF